MAEKIHFTKMHGAGNDYIYVDGMRFAVQDPEDFSIRWSKRHTGIGSDGLVLIGHSETADFSMRIFNNDGSEAMMCGNGVRCVGKYLYDKQLTEKTELKIETLSGVKELQLFPGEDQKVESVKVDMGEPILENKKQLATPTGGMIARKIKVGRNEYVGTFVSMGNPHFVIFTPNVDAINLETEGKELECAEFFPQRCNIEFAEVIGDGSIRTRVWERGSGITMACGTGACATAVAAVLNGKSKRTVTIAMDGGKLLIEWRETDNHIYMTGPVATVFEGVIELV